MADTLREVDITEARLTVLLLAAVGVVSLSFFLGVTVGRSGSEGGHATGVVRETPSAPATVAPTRTPEPTPTPVATPRHLGLPPGFLGPPPLASPGRAAALPG